MNAADLARLALAKRAYEAARPSVAEVQNGVRRARLSLRRPKPRRSWFSKGLVLVVLAVGSLAYAKPHGLVDLVARALEAPKTTRGGRADGRVASAVDKAVTPHSAGRGYSGAAGASRFEAQPSDRSAAAVASPAAGSASLHADLGALVVPAAAPSVALAAAPSVAPVEAPSVAPADRSAVTVVAAPERAVPPKPLANVSASDATARQTSTDRLAATPAGSSARENAGSSWKSVSQALARGDENSALAALSELSRSGDERTRSRAVLGRAQLLLARGQASKACALAQSLVERGAGAHIERQARALLESCTK